MTRIGLLTTLSCAAFLVGAAGCGSSSNNAAKDGSAGSDGAATGAGGSSATGAGGSSATGAGGSSATGAGGSSATGAGGGSATGTGGAAGADGGTLACRAGEACSGTETCMTSMGCRVGSQNVCFCDPNGQLACEGCQAPDGGPVPDAGVMTCPANANRTACDTPMAFCTLACGGAGNNVETCRCRAGGGGNADAGATWQCANACN